MITMNNINALNTEALELWGLTSDDKPIDWWTDQWGQVRKVGNGSQYYEMDSKTRYSFDEENSTWHIVPWDDVDGGSSGGGGDVVDATLSRTLNVSQGVGGIGIGKSYATGKSIEDILHDMLDPVAYPTLVDPTAVLIAPGSKLVEKGGTLNVTMTLTLNRGSISPAYGTSGYRSGVASTYYLNNELQANNTISVVVSEDNKTFTGRIGYEAGEQPKDSTGRDYNSPLAAGHVDSNTLTYEFVNPLYSNASDITNITKNALISKSARQKEWTFAAQTVANPEVFEVPASWNVTAVEFYNDFGGKYEDCASEFTITDITHDDAAGNPVAYKRYTDNRGFSSDPRKVRIKWS